MADDVTATRGGTARQAADDEAVADRDRRAAAVREADAARALDDLAALFAADDRLGWLRFASALFDALHARLTDDIGRAILDGVPAELVSQALGYPPGDSDSMAGQWDVAGAVAGQDWLMGNAAEWVAVVQALLDAREQLVLRPLLGRAHDAEEMLDELVGLVERVHSDPYNLGALARFGPEHCWWWRKLLPLAEQPEPVRLVLRRINSLVTHYREAVHA